MNTQHFPYIFAIESFGSVSKASEALYMSRTSLLYVLNNIENELGYKIFNRSVHGTIPTERGEKFLKEAHEVYSVIQNWYDEKKKTPESIIIFISDTVRKYIFYNIQKSFTAIYPEVALKFIDDICQSPEKIYHALQRFHRSIRVEVLLHNKVPDLMEMLEKENYTYEIVHSEPLKVYFSASNSLCRKEHLLTSDLVSFQFLAYPDFANKIIDSIDTLKVFKGKIPLQKGVVTSEEIWKSLQEGEVALLAFGIARNNLTKDICKKVISDLNIQFDYIIIHRKPEYLSVEEKTLVELISYNIHKHLI